MAVMMDRKRYSQVDPEDIEQFCEFLRGETCYEMLPPSYKVIMFDTTLQVNKAFFAMVQNETRAAPLWDSLSQRIVGMLTVTDFVHILRYYYYEPQQAHELANLAEQQIQTWRDLERNRNAAVGKPEPKLLTLSPNASLYEAAQILVSNRIHRLPLIEPSESDAADQLVGVISQIKVLRYISNQFPLRPNVLRRPLRELGIGAFSNLATARMDTPLIQVLDMFVTQHLSAVPIVDENNVLLDVYEKFDVSYLARDGSYNDLNMPISEALGHRIEEHFSGVQTCTMSDTLSSLFDALKTQNIHRLVVVDDEKHLEGIISVSDVLAFLLKL